ncbi:MAG: fibronectin type III domain-containing protein, partial [Actinomycetota bacterium]
MPTPGSGGVGSEGTFENGTRTGTNYSTPEGQAVIVRFPKSSLRYPVAGDRQATIYWNAPSGGGTPTSYTVTAYSGADYSVAGGTCTTTDLSDLQCTVTGLTNGTDYKFKVVASNASGPGTASAFTAVLTPKDPLRPTFSSSTTTTAASEFTFTVIFDEAVSGVENSDFTNSGTLGSCTTAVTPVSSTVYTLTMSACSAREGTVIPVFASGGAIRAGGATGPAAAATSTAVITRDELAYSASSYWMRPDGNNVLNESVSSLLVSDGKLFFSASDIGGNGNLPTSSGSPFYGVGSFDGTTWSDVGGSIASVSGCGVYPERPFVTSLTGTSTSLYAGGDFNRIGGVSASLIARYDGTSWSALGDGLCTADQGGGYHTIKTLLAGTDLYVTGTFRTANGSTTWVNGIAKWDG